MSLNRGSWDSCGPKGCRSMCKDGCEAPTSAASGPKIEFFFSLIFFSSTSMSASRASSFFLRSSMRISSDYSRCSRD